MGNIRAVAFDLEGTIVDVESAHHRGHICAAADFGIFLTIDECFYKLPHFIGGPDEEIAKEIAFLANHGKENPIEPSSVWERDKYHYNRLLETMPIVPRSGFKEVFEVLQDAGLQMTIGSGVDQGHGKLLLERSGLLNWFEKEKIVLREHFINNKPAPDVWIETARRAEVAPSDQLVFEDSARGILGAVEVGAVCVGMPVYNRIETVLTLVQAGAKRVFMDWREINPQALLENLNKERHAV